MSHNIIFVHWASSYHSSYYDFIVYKMIKVFCVLTLFDTGIQWQTLHSSQGTLLAAGFIFSTFTLPVFILSHVLGC